MYGHKFTSLFKSEDQLNVAQAEWAKALAPMTDEVIANGLDRCKYLADWNPSIAEFVRTAYELPSKQQCISRCLSGKDLDEVSYIAYDKAGGKSTLERLSAEKVIQRLSYGYEDAYEYVLREKLENPIVEEKLQLEDAESHLSAIEKRTIKDLRERAQEFDYVVSASKPLEIIEEEVSELERERQFAAWGQCE